MHIIHNLEPGYQKRIPLEGTEKSLYRLLEIPEKDILELSAKQKECLDPPENSSSKSLRYKDGNVIERIVTAKIDFKTLVEQEDQVVVNFSLPSINNSHLLCTVSNSYLSRLTRAPQARQQLV